MEFSLPVLVSLLRETLTAPRTVARQLMALGLPMSARWMALALIAALSALLGHLTLAIMTGGMANLLTGPVTFAVFQYGVLVVTAVLIHQIGAWRGGTGGFADALLLVIWLQFVLLCLQLGQLVAALVLPPLSDIIGILGIGLFFWLLTNFVAELHGFRALGRVFVGIILSFVVVATVLALVFGGLFGPPQGV